LAYDNTCKYLAEKYPAAFARWLLSTETTDIQVLKTELSLEPIRADSLAFLKVANQILHLEFQTTPYSEPPMSFRMLDYWVRLKRLYWNADIVQVVIYLKSIDSELAFVDQFQNDNTSHRYRVIRMWEQDPAPLLSNPVLLPLATLAQTDSPRALLQQVAEGVAMIEESSERSQLSTCIQLLAGLKFNQNLIRQLFRGEAMRESVIYQEILEEGKQQGIQQGVKEEALSLVSRLLNRRLGNISPEIQQQISQLSRAQLEELAEELLDFSQPTDLTNWLNSYFF
jgi:predicted transposase/invertase (TIGR01784 family)